MPSHTPTWAPTPHSPNRHRGLLLGCAFAATALVAGGLGFTLGTVGATANTSAADGATPAPASTTPSEETQAADQTTAEPTAEATPTPTPTPSPTPTCTKFTTLSDREFKKLARDSQSLVGKCYRVHGYVTQSDSATGATSFRANACGEKKQPQYGYIADCDTNSFFTALAAGNKTGIEDIVTDDAFTADVMVGPPYTYTTTMGGQMTAPSFAVIKITKYATTD
ncbi:hypothetical protein J7E89_08480 [Streptomyces sp. ISL-100]|nr:hypothetical protein [Streptomyces sp. ISL-100]